MQPGIRFIPKIIAFLGCNPLPPSQTLGQRIRRCRRSLGFSIERLARQLKVDPNTLGAWEAGTVKQPWPVSPSFSGGWRSTKRERIVVNLTGYTASELRPFQPTDQVIGLPAGKSNAPSAEIPAQIRARIIKAQACRHTQSQQHANAQLSSKKLEPIS